MCSDKMLKTIILKSIRFYQLFISPLSGPRCRFYPSCSQYAFLSVKKHGVLTGSSKAFKRILKCHPANPGGVDFP